MKQTHLPSFARRAPVSLASASRFARASLRSAALVVALGLGGCHFSPSCGSPKAPYLVATSNAPLTIPDGLTAPDRSAALIVPPAPAGQAPVRVARSKDNKRCLDEPPSYFGGPATASAGPDEFVAEWAQAWANRDVNTFMASYSKSFLPSDSSGSAEWLDKRRSEVTSETAPNAKLEDVKIAAQGDRRVVTFVQRFGSNAVRKELTLVKENGLWRIVGERTL